MKLCCKNVSRIMEAIVNRDCHKLLRAIDYGANVNVYMDMHKYTPLHYAVLTNFREGVELLVKHGANINAPAAKHMQYMTPIEQARLFQFESLICFLVHQLNY